MPNIKEILAVITCEKDVVGGTLPIFYAKDKEEQELIAVELGRILAADVHKLSTGVIVLKDS
ncbi:capping complex subunit for YIEGIA [Selenihalanaerobacter shriftii]|uniref:Uncharacterized protein n=1 Tax=Selenihalanaerobacter shriftii TaxID=142842 RepID=A0A1T4LW77_9FIRM|nr:hypothetical protein [Selenihalanaerobacter shriftii]SJZ58907.1 hypothetical protein SAMN02745118_01271 [Selenihalanaerobacter shriftii]